MQNKIDKLNLNNFDSSGMLVIEDKCIWCLDSVAMGDGKWAFRLPSSASIDSADWWEKLSPTQQLALEGIQMVGWSCDQCNTDLAGYSCPDCGATESSLAKDCCDTCILKFFSEDRNAPTLAEIEAIW